LFSTIFHFFLLIKKLFDQQLIKKFGQFFKISNPSVVSLEARAIAIEAGAALIQLICKNPFSFQLAA